jgi:hypothetical protein
VFWGMRKILVSVTIVLVGLVLIWLVVFVMQGSRVRAEHEHGIRLPPTATNIQCRGDAWLRILPDRGAATIFEMSTNDLTAFVAQLKITSRGAPVRTTNADPLINGYNIWPTNSKSFVPGGSQYGGFKCTWSGEPIPIEMLSCASPKGDWLHVELWKLPGDSLLVKMFTDWN